MKHKVLGAGVLLVALLTSGCASIFSGSSQKITVNSTPPGANVTIVRTNSNETVSTLTTPATVKLKRGAGYFKPASYIVRISMDGFATREVKLTSSLNSWYFANIAIGGAIGMVGVDPATGAMYKLSPKLVEVTLEAAPKASQIQADEQSFTVFLASALPQKILDQSEKYSLD
jgi:hypothetical protein